MLSGAVPSHSVGGTRLNGGRCGGMFGKLMMSGAMALYYCLGELALTLMRYLSDVI